MPGDFDSGFDRGFKVMADRYWVGDGGTNLWSGDCWAASSGGAPDAGGPPGAGDNALFDAASANDCNLDANTAVLNNFDCTGYANVFNQSGYDINVAGSTFLLSAGMTFNANGTVYTSPGGTLNVTTNGQSVVNLETDAGTTRLQDTLTLSGDLTVAGGSFDANGKTLAVSGTIYCNGTGSATLDATSTQDLDCTGCTGTLTLTDTLTVTGTLFTLVAGMTVTHNNQLVDFTNTSGTVVLTLGGKTLGSVRCGNAGAGATYQLTDALTLAQNLTIVNGNFNDLTNAISVGGNTVIQTAGNVNMSVFSSLTLDCTGCTGNLYQNDTWTITGTVFKLVAGMTFAHGSRLVDLTYTGGVVTITSGGQTLGVVRMGNAGVGGSYTLTDDMDVAGNLTLVNGSFTCSGNNLTVAGTIYYQSTGNMSLALTTTLSLDCAGASGTLTLIDTLTVSGTVFTLVAGMTFTPNGQLVDFTATSGTVQIVSAGKTFYSIRVGNAGAGATYQMSGDLSLSNNLTLVNGQWDSNGQALTVAGTMYLTGATVYLDAVTVGSLDCTGATGTLDLNDEFLLTGALFKLAAGLTLAQNGQNFHFQATSGITSIITAGKVMQGLSFGSVGPGGTYQLDSTLTGDPSYPIHCYFGSFVANGYSINGFGQLYLWTGANCTLNATTIGHLLCDVGYTGTLLLGGTLTITGTAFTLAAGMTFTHGNQLVDFVATLGTVQITTAGKTFYDVRFGNAGAGGTYQQQDALAIARDYTLVNGIYQTNTKNLTVGRDLTIQSTVAAGAFQASSGTHTIGRNLVLSGLGATNPVTNGTCTFRFTGSFDGTAKYDGRTSNSRFLNFYNLQISTNNFTWDCGTFSSHTVLNQLTMDAGAVWNAGVNATERSRFSVSSALVNGLNFDSTATWKMSFTWDLTANVTALVPYCTWNVTTGDGIEFRFNFAGTTGTFQLQSNTAITAPTFFVSCGGWTPSLITFNFNGFNLTVTGNVSNAGTLGQTGIKWNVLTKTFTISGSLNFYRANVATASFDLTGGGQLLVGGSITLVAGSWTNVPQFVTTATSLIRCTGNWNTSVGTVFGSAVGASTVEFNAAGAFTVSFNASELWPTVKISSSGSTSVGTWSLFALDCTGASGTLAQTGIWTIRGTTFKLVAAQTFTHGSNGIIFNATSGTVAITTSGKQLGAARFGNAGPGGTYQLQDALNLFLYMDLNAGVFDTNNKNVQMNGSLAVNAGAGANSFLAGSSTVSIGQNLNQASTAAWLSAGTSKFIFTGTGSITLPFGAATVSFYDLEIAVGGTTNLNWGNSCSITILHRLTTGANTVSKADGARANAFIFPVGTSGISDAFHPDPLCTLTMEGIDLLWQTGGGAAPVTIDLYPCTMTLTQVSATSGSLRFASTSLSQNVEVRAMGNISNWNCAGGYLFSGSASDDSGSPGAMSKQLNTNGFNVTLLGGTLHTGRDAANGRSWWFNVTAGNTLTCASYSEYCPNAAANQNHVLGAGSTFRVNGNYTYLGGALLNRHYTMTATSVLSIGGSYSGAAMNTWTGSNTGIVRFTGSGAVTFVQNASDQWPNIQLQVTGSISASAWNMATLDCTGATGTVTQAGTWTIRSTAYKLVAGMTLVAGTNLTDFLATAGTVAITTAGKTLGAARFGNTITTAIYQQQDALAVAQDWSLQGGSYQTQNFAVNAGRDLVFGSSLSAGALTPGSATITIGRNLALDTGGSTNPSTIGTETWAFTGAYGGLNAGGIVTSGFFPRLDFYNVTIAGGMTFLWDVGLSYLFNIFRQITVGAAAVVNAGASATSRAGLILSSSLTNAFNVAATATWNMSFTWNPTTSITAVLPNCTYNVTVGDGIELAAASTGTSTVTFQLAGNTVMTTPALVLGVTAAPTTIGLQTLDLNGFNLTVNGNLSENGTVAPLGYKWNILTKTLTVNGNIDRYTAVAGDTTTDLTGGGALVCTGNFTLHTAVGKDVIPKFVMSGTSAVTVGGSWNTTAGKVWQALSGSVTFTAAGPFTIASNAADIFPNVYVTGGGSTTLSNGFACNTLTITAGLITAGTSLTVYGTVNNAGTFTIGTNCYVGGLVNTGTVISAGSTIHCQGQVTTLSGFNPVNVTMTKYCSLLQLGSSMNITGAFTVQARPQPPGTIRFLAGGTFNIANLNSLINCTDDCVQMLSTVNGTRYNLNVTVLTSAANLWFRDCNYTGPVLTGDLTNVNLGNNVGLALNVTPAFIRVDCEDPGTDLLAIAGIGQYSYCWLVSTTLVGLTALAAAFGSGSNNWHRRTNIPLALLNNLTLGTTYFIAVGLLDDRNRRLAPNIGGGDYISGVANSSESGGGAGLNKGHLFVSTSMASES